ncbi:MAG: ABC transporter permease [Actinomycetes bacterium]
MRSTTSRPDPGRSPTAMRAGRTAMRIISVHGLLVLLVVVFVMFSLARPDTFPTAFNIRSILSDKSITVLVALAEMIVVTANQFDLSVGYGIGLGQILVIGLQTREHLPWPLAAAVVMAIGLVIGLFNGLLVTRAHIDSFIATLGVGTIIYGISEWYTGGAQILGNLPSAFRSVAGTVLGVPLPAVYVAVIGIGLWIVFEYLPLGRYLYVLGSNPRAAELSGISARRYILLAFMGSGLLTGFAGVVLGSRLGVGQSSVGPEYLLPAFVGALLGATSVRPGRANVWGTVLAVLLLGVAVAGLEQEGAQFYVDSLFNGGMLVLAVGLAGYAARRRLRVAAASRSAGRMSGDASPPEGRASRERPTEAIEGNASAHP